MPIDRVTVFDTTLRDGEQSPGCSMNLNEKVRMAVQLQELGVDVIEAGFPIASEGDFAAVKAVAAECREVTVAALCRTAEQDVSKAAQALVRRRAPTHSRLLCNFRYPSRTQIKKDSCRSDRNDARGRQPGAEAMLRRSSSQLKMQRAATSIISVKCWKSRWKQELRFSTFRTPSATQHRLSIFRSLRKCENELCGIET